MTLYSSESGDGGPANPTMTWVVALVPYEICIYLGGILVSLVTLAGPGEGLSGLLYGPYFTKPEPLRRSDNYSSYGGALESIGLS